MRRRIEIHEIALVLTLTLISTSLGGGDALAQHLFADPVAYPVGANPNDVKAADLNLDNWPDLVVVNQLGSVSVLLNQGDGTFYEASSFDVGASPRAVCVCRLDEDMYPEIITSNSESNTISVLFNRGDGTFDPAVDYPVGMSPYGIATADLNGDTASDVAVVNRNSLSVSLFLNDGTGTLIPSGGFSAGGAYTKPTWLAVGDLDADQDADIAVVKNYFNLYFSAGYVEIFRNDGTGNFTSTGTITTGRSATTPLTVDLDGDEDLDLAISGFVDNSYKLSVLLNDGNGHFGDPVAHYAFADGRACSGDFDLDGNFDVAISKVNSGAFSVLLNHGNATFASAFTVSVGSDPMGIAAEDLDRDGDTDIAVAVYGENTVAVVMSTANPTSAVDEPDWVGQPYSLGHNVPNPFNPLTTISYSLPRASWLHLEVFTIAGRSTRSLVDGWADAGEYRTDWDGRDDLGRTVPSGVYFYRLEAGEYVETKRMTLVR